jgi:ubiquinone/menaquinone biosynthesis C-methylase UbiE
VRTGVRTTEGWRANATTERILGRVDWSAVIEDIDWDEAAKRLNPPPMPDYVRSSIHGIEGGYSTVGAASTWDPVVAQIFAEYDVTEEQIRDSLTARVDGPVTKILDVACGTGESTRAWRRRFPDASIVAMDVAPAMVALAERKLMHDMRTEVRCLDAEHLPFPDASFDLVTAMLLFHELPAEVSPVVLGQMARVCRPGAWIAVLEPYQVGGRILDPIPFPEPYLKDFLSTDWDQAFRAAGFNDVEAHAYGEGWIRTARKLA